MMIVGGDATLDLRGGDNPAPLINNTGLYQTDFAAD